MPSQFSIKNNNLRGLKVTEIIDSQTGTGASNVFTFNNIPQTYKDLDLHINYAGTTTGTFHFCVIQFNGVVTAANYYHQRTYGNAAAAGAEQSIAAAGFILVGKGSSVGTVPSMYSTAKIHIPDYANSTTYTTSMGTLASAGEIVEQFAGVFVSTSPITSILIGIASGGNLTTASKATLYGVPW